MEIFTKVIEYYTSKCDWELSAPLLNDRGLIRRDDGLRLEKNRLFAEIFELQTKISISMSKSVLSIVNEIDKRLILATAVKWSNFKEQTE